MKHIKIQFGCLCIFLIPFLMNCKGDDPTPLTNQQQAAKELSFTWASAQVLSSPVPSADGTLENLRLTFTTTQDFEPSTFSASGAPDFFLTNTNSIWSWEGTSSAINILLLNVSPVQAFTVDELSATSLTIRFSLDGPVEGRTKGIGEYQVKLTRQ